MRPISSFVLPYGKQAVASTHSRLANATCPIGLLIPETLYGRAREVETLLAAFDRVARTAWRKLVLVSGYSGIGKSAVVNELHKGLVPPRGLFVAGKFDQYKRDIPYSTLIQAFQSLVRSLLGKSDTELGGLARRTSGGARCECAAHDRLIPGIEAHHRRARACAGT